MVCLSIVRGGPSSVARSDGAAMQIIIEPNGAVRCIYTEEIDLTVLGQPTITRASHVEPDQQGSWWADLSPVDGGVLGPFDHRSAALEAEARWLEDHWLSHPAISPGHRQAFSGLPPAGLSASP